MVDACRQGLSLKMGARLLWSSSFCMASLHRLTGDLSLGSFFFINVLAFLTCNKQAISCVLSQIWNTRLPTSPSRLITRDAIYPLFLFKGCLFNER